MARRFQGKTVGASSNFISARHYVKATLADRLFAFLFTVFLDYLAARVELIGQIWEIGKMLDINERQTNGTTILDLKGNVIMGGGSKRLGEDVRRAVKAGNTNVLLNFSAVKYLDSSGVGELIALSETINRAEGSLKLSNLPPKVEEVLTLSGVLPIFDIYDDERYALESE